MILHAPNPALNRSPALGLLLVLLSSAPSLHAQSPTLLRLRSSTALDRLVVDSAGMLLMRGTYTAGAVQNPGAGSMLMWYPRRAAFRAGLVTGTQWNDANVGSYSFATGANARASGLGSIAMGLDATASHQGSVALGHFSTASGQASTAMGQSSTASGAVAIAMGMNTVASGANSSAIGNASTATGSNSTAIGRASTAGVSSTAIGYNASATNWSIAMGLDVSASGEFSTAIGRFVSTNSRPGAIVIGDGSIATTMNATADHQFSLRAAGGVRLFTSSGLSSGVTLAPGGGTWNVVSDRNRKEQFLGVDGEEILSRVTTLAISTWRYIAEEDRGTRHIGPMAQDWNRAFGFSADSLTINSGDFDGVNLAAVQALAERTDRLQAENQVLRAIVAELQGQNLRQEERLRRLEDRH